MKKTLFISMLVVLLFLLVGCNEAKDEDNKSNSSKATLKVWNKGTKDITVEIWRGTSSIDTTKAAINAGKDRDYQFDLDSYVVKAKNSDGKTKDHTANLLVAGRTYDVEFYDNEFGSSSGTNDPNGGPVDPNGPQYPIW